MAESDYSPKQHAGYVDVRRKRRPEGHSCFSKRQVRLRAASPNLTEVLPTNGPGKALPWVCFGGGPLLGHRGGRRKWASGGRVAQNVARVTPHGFGLDLVPPTTSDACEPNLGVERCRWHRPSPRFEPCEVELALASGPFFRPTRPRLGTSPHLILDSPNSRRPRHQHGPTHAKAQIAPPKRDHAQPSPETHCTWVPRQLGQGALEKTTRAQPIRRSQAHVPRTLSRGTRVPRTDLPMQSSASSAEFGRTLANLGQNFGPRLTNAFGPLLAKLGPDCPKAGPN